MTKKIAAMAAFALAFGNGFAQEKENDDAELFTVRAGYSLTKLNNVTVDGRQNFYVGAAKRFRISKWFSLQPEITYTRQGARVNSENPYNLVDGLPNEMWKLDYVGVTLANKFYVYRGLHLMLTANIDVLVHHEMQFEPRENHDVGVGLGIGYEFKNGLGIEARAKLGSTEVVRIPFYDVVKKEISNGGGFFGLTYKFSNKTKHK